MSVTRMTGAGIGTGAGEREVWPTRALAVVLQEVGERRLLLGLLRLLRLRVRLRLRLWAEER